MITILQGDVIDKLQELKDQSVHCITTSPAYWGLRDYSANKEFKTKREADSWTERSAKSWNRLYGSDRLRYLPQPSTEKYDKEGKAAGWIGHIRFETLWEDGIWCPHGLEETPEQYVTHTLEVFKELWRVLRDDGTVWLNMGDCYSGSNSTKEAAINPDSISYKSGQTRGGISEAKGIVKGLKPKDLLMMPARVAMALQADGWYLRSDIIWNKPNPMPESVTDRPTKSHEYIFLLTKNARYFYDQDAIREPVGNKDRSVNTTPYKGNGTESTGGKLNKWMEEHGGRYHPSSRNIRSVWEICPQPRPEAHFATFPDEIPRRCIKAGTSEYGCCPKCGAPYQRIVEASGGTIGESWHPHENDEVTGQVGGFTSEGYKREFKGWQPGCKCDAGDPVPCVVLDPFMGSGTTLKVARDLKRDAIGIEINPEYVKIARERLRLNEQLVI